MGTFDILIFSFIPKPQSVWVLSEYKLSFKGSVKDKPLSDKNKPKKFILELSSHIIFFVKSILFLSFFTIFSKKSSKWIHIIWFLGITLTKGSVQDACLFLNICLKTILL